MEFEKIHLRAENVEVEFNDFSARCKENIANAVRIKADLKYMIEEAMILKEEFLASNARWLYLLNMDAPDFGEYSQSALISKGIEEDISVLRGEVDEISQTIIPGENINLLALRNDFLSLSFLMRPDA
jgi:hypothetical protein